MVRGGGGEIPRRAVVRGARLAALPAAHAGRVALGLGRRLGGSPAEAVAAEVQRRTAEQLFAVLGELKGGAMKAGQALSAMEAALPEEVAAPYREALVRLQEAAPPMPAGLVHAELARGLGPGWRQRLPGFPDAPTAAASIGQVHRATWLDPGSGPIPVAVKVQYPGAGAALAADLRQLDRLVPLVRVAAPGLDARALVAELRARLAEEVDYAAEAQAQRAFADAYRGDPDIAVPEVVAVADRVLVTRWLDGTPLAQVVRHGSAAERDRAGLLLVRLLLSGPPRAGRLHGDPHPGNFRLLADGRLGVLDFGATEALPGGWPAGLGPLLAAARDRDAAGLLARARDSGLLRGARGGSVAAADLLDLVDPLVEPLRAERHGFTRAWLQEQTRRTSDPRSPAARVQRRLDLPARHLLVQRVALGVTGVLCSLGATVAVGDEARRWLPGLDGPPGPGGGRGRPRAAAPRPVSGRESGVGTAPW